MRKVNEEIAISSFWNFITILSSRLGGLIFVVIIARYLMPESFGIYNLALSVSLIFLYFIDSGINQSLLKYVAEALGKKNQKLAKANFKYLLKLKLSMALILSMMLLVLAYPLSFFIFKKPDLFLPLAFMGVYILSFAFSSFYQTYFYVIKKIKYLTIRQSLFEIIRIIGVLILYSVVARKYYVIGTLGVITLTTLFVTLYLIYNLKRLSPYIFNKSNEVVEKKRIFSFFIYMGIMGSLFVIFGYIDIIIIGILLDAAYVGYYSAAIVLAGSIWSFLNISYILLPIFTQMKDSGLETSINKVFRYISILAIPAIFGIFVLGRYFIHTIYGYEYLPAVIPFYILSLLILITPLASVLISLFSAKEKPKYVIKIIIISIILNVFLDFILISYLSRISLNLSIVGAAIATLISELFYLSGLLIYTKRTLKIKLKPLYLIRPIISGAIMFLALYSINYYLGEISLIVGILEILLGATIYILVMILIKGIEKEDIKLVRFLVKKINKSQKS